MDLTPILQPLAEGAVTAAGLAITAGVGLGLKWLSAHLAILRTTEAQKMIVGANAIVQAAAENASSKIVADIQAGRLDPTNRAGLVMAASDLVSSVKGKVPDAVALLQPAEGAIAGMIVDKAIAQNTKLVAAAPVVAPVTPPSITAQPAANPLPLPAGASA
ncbi:MAG TPA: hypothetical protein VFG62_25910 [Rhodopila sp.]|jgi:hypothetical protein|nr:hypothetical protein [Rhodopila sp.]